MSIGFSNFYYPPSIGFDIGVVDLSLLEKGDVTGVRALGEAKPEK